MRFSVLMPAYNVEKYIAEAVESITNKTFEDWELVIVDDGSTDKSGQIADDYAKKDSRIKVIHKTNGGLISARREGIKHACGEYCLFCDSDDFVKDLWMESIDSVITEFNFPDIVLFNLSTLSEQTKEVVPRYFPWSEKCEIDPNDARFMLISSSNINELVKKAVKRELLLNDPLDYSKNYSGGYAEDRLQSLYPLDACKRIAVLPEELYYYRINDSSMMHSKMNIEKVVNYTHVDVQRVTYPYVIKWEQDIPGLRNEFFKQCYHNMANVYKKMILTAESKNEIAKINGFRWDTCLPLENMDGFDKKKYLSLKDRVLSHMAISPTMLGAYLLRLAYKILRKKG